MAEKVNPQIEESQKRILEAQREMELTQKRIDALNERTIKAKDKQLAKLKEQIKKEQESLSLAKKVVDEESKRVEQIKERVELEKDVNKFVKEQGDIYNSLSKEAQKELSGRLKGETALGSVASRLIDLKQNQLVLEGDDLKLNNRKLEVFQSLEEEIVSQAKENAKHLDHRSAKQKEEETLRKKMKGFSQDEIEEAIQLLKIKQKLEDKEERLKQIHEQQHKMAHILPDSVQSALGFVKEMGSVAKSMSLKLAGTFLLAGALMAAYHAFSELDKAAEDYRKETGMTVSQTEELGHQAHHIEMYYRKVGVELKDVYDTANSLANVFSDVVAHSEQTLAAISLMKSNFGVSTQTGAEVQGIFEQIGGLSQQSAANVQMQTINLAKQLKVSPKEMMEDIAKSAGITAKYFKGDVTLLVKQAAEAKRLGTNLQEVEKTAEGLLDFENGIEKELVAATFVGGQFNLSRARALAYEGKIVDAQNASLDAIEQAGDFTKMDVFSQRALADATNMSVEQITKQLGMRKQLANLSDADKKAAEDAIAKGLDVSDLNEEQLKQKVAEFSKQQEINGQLTKMEDSFKGIIASLGGTLMPLMTALVPVMEMLFKPLEFAVKGIQLFIKGLQEGKAGAIAMAVVLSPLLVSMVGSAISAIFAGLSWLGPFGVPLAVAAVAGYLSTMKSAKSEAHAGDFMENSEGQTTISTREGGLVKLSPNDDVVAFPGATKALANQQQPQVSAPSIVASSNNNMISALIQEFRGVRADMASGKIGVYMDGDKVTSGVATVVGRSTRNDFALQ